MTVTILKSPKGLTESYSYGFMYFFFFNLMKAIVGIFPPSLEVQQIGHWDISIYFLIYSENIYISEWIWA